MRSGRGFDSEDGESKERGETGCRNSKLCRNSRNWDADGRGYVYSTRGLSKVAEMVIFSSIGFEIRRRWGFCFLSAPKIRTDPGSAAT